MSSENINIFNKSCYSLPDLENESIHALITDPPYGIKYQLHHWDKSLPDPSIWIDSLRVLKPGGFGLIFSSVRLMHRLMVSLEDQGFLIKDVLFWVYLNGMPKTRNVGLDIDKELGVESKNKGHYKYMQGYRKGGSETYTNKEKKPILSPASEKGKQYDGAGLGIKPAYEPIILVQKPLEEGLTVAQNMIKYGTGALNLESSRIPYQEGEGKIGHNPHPNGRVTSNILRTNEWNDGYDKFFVVPKVRQHAEDFNNHPTLKPVALMHHLINLVTFEGQNVLDPFMGSGSTGLACKELRRKFTGYELENEYYLIAKERLGITS